MELSIIIVSYNTSKLLQVCLQSVVKALSFGHLGKKSELIVVDNASTDDSVTMVRSQFPKVLLICNKKNLGFARANNQGINKSQSKYVLLLNSDTEISQDSLNSLIKLAEKEKKIGIIGCQLLNKDGSIQQSVGYFPTLWKVFFWMSFLDDVPGLTEFIKPYHVVHKEFYKKFHEVDWVTGAFILAKREVIDKAGLLDERIFMYGEEVEWCYRIKKEGYKVYYYPVTSVYHHKGGSGAGKDSGIIEEFAYLLYFYSKHMSSWRTEILRIILLFGALLRFLLFGIIMRNSKKASFYAKALKMVG